MDTDPTDTDDSLARERPPYPWRNVLFGVGAVAVLGWLIAPAIIPRGKRPADRAEAYNNLRQISVLLFEFEDEYGKLPGESTIAAVKANTNTSLDLGSSSSNQLFRQLLAVGLKSEKPFWCKTEWSKKKPDDIFTVGKALEPGEVGFAYIAGLSSKTDDPLTPLVVTPLIPGTTRFDLKAYGEKAIILRLDNSTSPLPIRKDGEVWVNGMNLFDPRQPFWKGKAPDIKWAEKP